MDDLTLPITITDDRGRSAELGAITESDRGHVALLGVTGHFGAEAMCLLTAEDLQRLGLGALRRVGADALVNVALERAGTLWPNADPDAVAYRVREALHLLGIERTPGGQS